MATVSNLYVDQGTDFSAIVTLKNQDGTTLNLTGFTVVSQFRKSYQSSSATNFTVTIYNAAQGKIRMQLPAATSGLQETSMFEKLSIKLVAIGLAAILVLGGLYWIYNSIYTSGYNDSQVQCNEKFQQLQHETDRRLADLQAGLQVLGGKLGNQQAGLRSDMAKILTTVRNNTIIVSKNGKCEPSPEFVDSINKAIQRANQK